MKRKKSFMRPAAMLLALLLTVSGISVPTVYAADLDSAVTESTDETTVSGTEEPEESVLPASAEGKDEKSEKAVKAEGDADAVKTEEDADAAKTEKDADAAKTEKNADAAKAEKDADAVKTEEGADAAKAEKSVGEDVSEDIAEIEQIAALSEDGDNSSEDDTAAMQEENSEEAGDTAPVGKLELVYGNKDLADEDALVLLIMGDGFTDKEQDKFYGEAAKTAKYMMECSPFDEFTDVFKIYALGTVSNESGAQGENADNEDEAEADVRDTYFGATFWSWGMQRLVTLSEEGEAKGEALKAKYLPLADFNVYLVNSETYGGSGGSYCVASLNTQSLEMMLHELGHTIGNLADEYYAAGYEGEYANLTAESDADNVPWARFVGKNGVGVYDWGGQTGTGYYIPHTGCKMQYLGAEYPFCEVCKEQLRKSFCEKSNVTKMFFQTYADEFLSGEGTDMSQYFILRRGSSETTGDQLGDALTLTYYDADGNELKETPTATGTYTVKAEFKGNGNYDACEATGSYTIDAVSISLKIASKVRDGKPADLSYSVKGADDYSIVISYTGVQYYTYYVYDYYESTMSRGFYTPMDTSDDLYDVYCCKYDSYYDEYLKENTYQSTEGPVDTGSYTVTLTVYDNEGNFLGTKSMDYTISFPTSKIVNNNDDSGNYYGAFSAGNNKDILIFGEGFTEEEQDEFLEMAGRFAKGILNLEPFRETRLHFNFTAVNCISEESGIGTEAKDTFFGLTRDENGKIIESYNATNIVHNLAYSINAYYDGCIVIVNDKEAKESSTYFYDYEEYRYFHAIFAVPDENGIEYAAAELLNHLTGEPVGRRAETDAEKEAQRLSLIESLHYDYSPIIVSRAYDEIFTENGKAIDLTPYFHVYYGGEELAGVPLQLTYYADDNGEPGAELNGAPSKAGTYHVLAETLSNYDGYWVWYVPEGASEDDGLWLGLSRGWTTYTIQPAAAEEETGKEETTETTEPSKEENSSESEKSTAESEEKTAESESGIETTEASKEESSSETAVQKPSANNGNSQNGSGTGSSSGSQKTDSTVETGDNSNAAVWAILLIISAGMAVVMLTMYRRKTRR